MSGRIKSEEKRVTRSVEKKNPKRETSASRKKSPARVNVKDKNTSLSETRNKSPSRNKSPARTPRSPKNASIKTPTKKSPSRKSTDKSPSRKSPSRKSPSRKSPSRKSPSRVSPLRESPSRKSPSRSPSRQSSLRKSPGRSVLQLRSGSQKKEITRSTPNVDSDSDTTDTKSIKPEVIYRGRSMLFDYESEEAKNNPNYYYGTKRRHTRSSESRDPDRIVHLKSDIFTLQNKLSEFSDEDEFLLSKKVIDSIEPRSYQKEFVTEFGGWFGALFLIIAMPLSVIALNIICTKDECAFRFTNLEPYKTLSAFVDISAILGLTSYLILLALLSALPFGGHKVTMYFYRFGKLSFVMNGIFQVAIILIIIFGLELNGVSIVNFIYEKYFQLAVSSIVLSILFSIYLYARSFFVPVGTLNPNGDTNSIVYNFFMGRELLPRIFNVVDIKIYFLRVLCISMILLNSTFMYKSLGLPSPIEIHKSLDWKLVNFDPTVLTFGMMITIYFLDLLVFEHGWLTTFEMQCEGVGYMSTIWYFSASFLLATMPKYVLDHKVNFTTWKLVSAYIQFLFGYMIYRVSNNQKDSFRTNPYSPSVAHLETIPTSQGKKLIVSGFWGFVRHPNYLGQIIMYISFMYFLVGAPPSLVCLLVLVILIHRTKRDGQRCKQRYVAAWDRYCQRVKYVLIPKIY